MTVLNAIVAEQLQYFHDGVEELIQGKNMKKDDAIFNLLREEIKHIKKILLKGRLFRYLEKRSSARA